MTKSKRLVPGQVWYSKRFMGLIMTKSKRLVPGQVWYSNGWGCEYKYYIKSVNEFAVFYDVFKRDNGCWDREYNLYLKNHQFPTNSFLESDVYLLQDVKKSSYEDPDYKDLWV